MSNTIEIPSGTASGIDDGGVVRSFSVTGEGHQEIAIHYPLNPFGSVHTENLFPVFQTDSVYGLNDGQVAYSSSLGGSVTNSNSANICATGTTVGGNASIQSRRRLRYRPGQGVVGRFAGTFSTPANLSYQVIGFGHSEDGLYFGYKNTTFGIIHNSRGVREQQTLTVSTGATSSANCTITLNDVAYTVALTNASNIQRTVYEIASATYAGWRAFPTSSTTVMFLSDSVGDKTGAFSFSAGTTGAAASIAETRAGVAVTETFIAQSSWNGDKLDGTGPSGVTLDPTKGNVYQIGIQYLGYGALTFKIEITPTNGNNATWVTVHTIRYTNAYTVSSFGNPSFPFTQAAYSLGSTTNVSVSVTSFAGFIEGMLHNIGSKFSYFNSLTSVGSANLQALFTVLNSRTYKGRSNQAVVYLLSVLGALKHTSPCLFYLIKNGTLAGNPSFAAYSAQSVTLYDSAATTVTYSDNSQLVWTGHLGDTGNIEHHFEDISLQPGEYITLAAKAVTGTPSYVTGSINTREDQ